MKTQRRWLVFPRIVCGVAVVVCLLTGVARAANPTAETALKLQPVQEGIDYDRPSAGQAAQCTIVAANGNAGWVVTSPEGTVLRKFLDTNGDNRVDCWSYYKDGLEVYRDVDSDFDRKVDQCRWFHTAGCRWGIDEDEDGKVDRWKAISAEEVAAEAVAALADGDWPRMRRLIVSADESKSLGLGKEKSAALQSKLDSLEQAFQKATGTQKIVEKDAQWLQFSGGTPGVVPEGTDGSTKDVVVYENAIAVVNSGGKPGEVLLGTLVRVDDGWRLIDVPQPLADGPGSLTAGFFFAAPVAERPNSGSAGPDPVVQQLLTELERIDAALQKATDAVQQAKLHAQRADLLEKVAEAADTPQNRVMWYHQLADMVSAAVQTGAYPDGAKRLGQLYDKLGKTPADKNLAAYVRFRQIMAEYGLSFQVPKPDYEKIQKTLVENLEDYVEQYPNGDETPEAMLQLAMTLEFMGEEESAKKWHERIVRDAPSSPVAQKARGAYTRLDSVGKQVTISGKSPTGQKVDVADYRGKVVLVQYWATWCEPAKTDIPALKELVSKYGGRFHVVGVSLDNRLADLQAYLKEHPLPWPQIFEEGGLDSRPANELGILTVPTMILIDPSGKVVSRNVSVAELDGELKAMLNRDAGSRVGSKARTDR